jgi:hypothetical protein
VYLQKYVTKIRKINIAGNMWGTCANGTEAVGCGLPETFRNCADVTITTSTAGFPPAFIEQDNPFLLYYRDSRKPTSLSPLVIRLVWLVHFYYFR